MIRRLSPLALLLCVACGGEVAPTPEPSSAHTAPSPTAAPSPTGAGTDATPPRAPEPGPDAARPKGPGPVGAYAIDPEDRKTAIAGTRKRIDDEIERRVAALPPERRIRAESYARAAADMVRRAIDVLEKAEIALEVLADGTATYRSAGLGPEQTTACTWVEEGGMLVLHRKEAPVDAEGSIREMRFRRTGDVLEWERPSEEEREGPGLVPIRLRRR